MRLYSQLLFARISVCALKDVKRLFRLEFAGEESRFSFKTSRFVKNSFTINSLPACQNRGLLQQRCKSVLAASKRCCEISG